MQLPPAASAAGPFDAFHLINSNMLLAYFISTDRHPLLISISRGPCPPSLGLPGDVPNLGVSVLPHRGQRRLVHPLQTVDLAKKRGSNSGKVKLMAA